MEKYTFPNEPVADPVSTINGPQYRFTVLDSRVIRYEWAEDGQFEDRPSTFAILRRFPRPEFRVEDKGDLLEIITPSVRLSYDKKRFAPNGLSAAFTSKLTEWGAEWRYGQESDSKNLGGTARTLDGVDGRCDMGAGILSRAGYANIDDSTSMLFDERGFVSPRRPGDRVDGYLFAYGRDYKGAMESFYAISGKQPTVPRWSLGNWWSRFYAYTEDEYLSLMHHFREEQIPLSVAVIDMDWHWRTQDFVPHTGWTGYTWNTDLFPDPPRFAKSLHDMGLRITLNDHPHSGIHKHEEVYDELAKVIGHDTTHGNPVAFDPTSPAFMHAFFNIVHRNLEKKGCDFWWIDWQQGTDSRIPGFDPLWLLNHFQFLDTKQTLSSSLPLIFSRYAGPGSHRYPVGFSGDTVASWESLQFQPEFTATASNIGFGWWSHDIGGHLPGYRADECATRWVQYGVFSPLLRLHSTVSQWMSKEPWLYRSEHRLAMRAAMQLRHRLVPYIYAVNAALAPAPSLPLVQPLYWNYPERDAAYRYPNQYFFGPSMIVAPIVTPRDPRTNLAKVQVWLPPHRHVDLFTGTVYDGDREMDVYRPLDQVPVFLPEGSIIPLDREKVPRNGCANPEGFEVLVVIGRDGSFDLVEDPRDDPNPAEAAAEAAQPRTISFRYEQSSGTLTISNGGGRQWTIRFLSIWSRFAAWINDTQVETEAKLVEEGRGSHDTVICLPAVASSMTDQIRIQLTDRNQLSVRDHEAVLKNRLMDYQIGFHDKDRIWEILHSKQNTTVKVSRLLSLGLDEALFGPIAELLLADSRADS